jgi:hypothetical protein
VDDTAAVAGTWGQVETTVRVCWSLVFFSPMFEMFEMSERYTNLFSYTFAVTCSPSDINMCAVALLQNGVSSAFAFA